MQPIVMTKLRPVGERSAQQFLEGPADIVTNLSRPAERVVAFYNHRGTAEQYIKEGKYAIKWTRLSCSMSTAEQIWSTGAE